MALEVRRGLVSAEGASRYGVALSEGNVVDTDGTASLREQMRADRPDELPVFDMGPSIDELLERCEEETGLPAPKRPVWTS